MNTTIFLPMPIWQAMAFLRDRNGAFARLLNDAGHLPCELVLVEDNLFGFKNRADAVEVGKRVYPDGFAMVRFVVVGKVLNGKMTFQRQVVGHTDPGTGTSLYRITRDGLQVINERVDSGDTDVVVDQIFGNAQEEEAKCCDADGGKDSKLFGLLEDGGRPAGFAPRGSQLPDGGPTGFGGC
jgi:hypothetical protein